jgi:hypothetical protein
MPQEIPNRDLAPRIGVSLGDRTAAAPNPSCGTGEAATIRDMSRSELTPEPGEPQGPGDPPAPVPQAPYAPAPVAPTAPVAPAPDALRASHEDRDEVVEQLRVAAGDGRLTAEELDERLGTALTARTYGELAVLVRDLPLPAGHAPVGRAVRPGSAVLGAEPAPEVVRLQARHSSLERTGPWIVPRRLEVEAKSANAVVDLTRAVVSHSVLDLAVALRSTNLQIVVPPGVVVTVDELSVHSSNVRQRVVYPPGAPVSLLVRVSGEAHSSNVVVRGPHEGFWARRRRLRAARQALTA